MKKNEININILIAFEDGYVEILNFNENNYVTLHKFFVEFEPLKCLYFELNNIRKIAIIN
jgi:hypothetical protein